MITRKILELDRTMLVLEASNELSPAKQEMVEKCAKLSATNRLIFATDYLTSRDELEAVMTQYINIIYFEPQGGDLDEWLAISQLCNMAKANGFPVGSVVCVPNEGNMLENIWEIGSTEIPAIKPEDWPVNASGIISIIAEVERLGTSVELLNFPK